MCAIFGVKVDYEAFLHEFGLNDKVSRNILKQHFSENKRVYPYSNSPVIINEEDQLTVKMMNYSLVPSWSKTPRVKFATHNARIETVTEKPTWKKPFSNNHCLVPLTHFYEPVYEGRFAGNMVTFTKDDDGLLVAAGVYDTWLNKQTGEVVDSFAILTKEPNDFIEEAGHDRMPIFLNNNRNTWLNKVKQPQKAVQWLMDNQYTGEFKAEKDRALKNA